MPQESTPDLTFPEGYGPGDVDGPWTQASGISARIRVPQPGWLSNASVPLKASIWSCRPPRPLPVDAHALPTPSSPIVNMRRPSNDVATTRAGSAFAYLATFVRAPRRRSRDRFSTNPIVVPQRLLEQSLGIAWPAVRARP